MKQNKVRSMTAGNTVTNIKSKVNSSQRKFWITRCNVCSGIDGAVEQLKEYNATRDLAEWKKEGRKVSEYVQINRAPLPWCDCLYDDEVEEENN